MWEPSRQLCRASCLEWPHTWFNAVLLLKILNHWELSCGTVVRAPCFYSWWHRFNPLPRELRSPRGTWLKKKKILKDLNHFWTRVFAFSFCSVCACVLSHLVVYKTAKWLLWLLGCRMGDRRGTRPCVSHRVVYFESGSVQFSSIAQSCPTLCDPMDGS